MFGECWYNQFLMQLIVFIILFFFINKTAHATQELTLRKKSKLIRKLGDLTKSAATTVNVSLFRRNVWKQESNCDRCQFKILLTRKQWFRTSVPNLGNVRNLKGVRQNFKVVNESGHKIPDIIFLRVREFSFSCLGVREQKKIGNHWFRILMFIFAEQLISALSSQIS